MKRLSHIAKGALVMIFTTTAFVASAQTTWSTSKDVQKIQNKALFRDENLKRSHIQARSVEFPAVAVSKGIHQRNADKTQMGNVASTGYPEWTISKGVKRKK